MTASRRMSIRTRRRTRKSTAALTAMLVICGSSALFTSAKPAAAAATWFPDLQVVLLGSVKNSKRTKSVTVNCPVGKAVINAGGYIINGDGWVTMEEVVPDPALNSVTVTAYETDPTPKKWAIMAVASCATAPPGLVWVSVPSPLISGGQSVTASCPPGTTLLGTGASVQGGFGNVVIDEIKPDGGPLIPGTQVTVEAYEDSPPFGSLWSVTAFASCAAPIPGQQVIWRLSSYDPQNKKEIEAFCPAGQVATGGGAEVGSLGALPGEVVINDMVATPGVAAAPGAMKVRGYEEDPIPLIPPAPFVNSSWAITAFAICADF